jgi:DNA adenine methylase
MSAKKKQQNQPTTRPFLKWAGGKFRLVDKILAALPEGKRLIEPFSGAAAVTLNSQYQRYWLNDVNYDLITMYKQLKTNHHEFIEYAEHFFEGKYNTEKHYYQLRAQFNNTTDILEKSALFLYLNRHGYNGLCRYNSKGGFNVPFGRHIKPYFPKEQLEFFSKQSKKVKLTHQSFEIIMKKTKPGDVVYCDPPYVPLTTTANFTQYSQEKFSLAQQGALADSAKELAKSGIPVVISNHNTPFTRDIYRDAKLKKFTAARRLSCNGNKRAPAKELIAIFS